MTPEEAVVTSVHSLVPRSVHYLTMASPPRSTSPHAAAARALLLDRAAFVLAPRLSESTSPTAGVVSSAFFVFAF